MKELNGKVYEVLFNPNLNSMERYERVKDLLQEAYDMGSRDSDKVMFDFLAGSFDEVEF